MFKDQLNQFSCLRQIVQLIHSEMGLDSELNVTKAVMAMKTAIAAGPTAEVDAHGVLVRANSNPMEMVSEQDIRSSNNQKRLAL